MALLSECLLPEKHEELEFLRDFFLYLKNQHFHGILELKEFFLIYSYIKLLEAVELITDKSSCEFCV